MKKRFKKPTLLAMNAMAAAMTGIMVVSSVLLDKPLLLIPAGIFYIIWCIVYVKSGKTFSIR